MGEAAELAGKCIAFKASTLKVSGPINYKTDTIKVCCRRMKLSLYRAKHVYNNKGVRLWGDQEYLTMCPYCGARF